MVKVNYHSTGKIWENASVPVLWVLEKFWVKQKSKQFPKHEKSEFPYYGKGMKNTNIPKLWFFLDTSGELENHFIPKTG